MWTKRTTSRPCQLARRVKWRPFRKRLAGEILEQRFVLDGTGLIAVLLADVEPDSQLGEDPHVDAVGPDASTLEFTHGNHARVNSYIDSAADVDVFQFAASGETLRIAGFLVEGQAAVHVLDAAGQNVVAVDETEPADGFVQCEWGDFGFCDFFPTTPGETYFVTIGGRRVDTSEYFFDFLQDTQPLSPTVSEPDSQAGDDPHPDQVGEDATVLEFDGQNPHARVNSFLDRPGDIDVFQFQATGEWANVEASTADGNLRLALEVLNRSQDILASNINNEGLDFVAQPPEPFVEVITVPGELYYLKVSGTQDAVGEYVFRVSQAPDVNDRVVMSGDANFDGAVDATDFAVWNRYRFREARGPQQGDFNGDGVADVADFNIWNDNRFTRLAATRDGGGSGRVPRAPAGSGIAAARPAAAPAAISWQSAIPTTKYASLTAQKVDHVMSGQTAAYAPAAGSGNFTENRHLFGGNGHMRPNVSSRAARMATGIQSGSSCAAHAGTEPLDDLMADFDEL